MAKNVKSMVQNYYAGVGAAEGAFIGIFPAIVSNNPAFIGLGAVGGAIAGGLTGRDEWRKQNVRK